MAKKQGTFKLWIDLDKFKLNIEGDNAYDYLREVNLLLDKVYNVALDMVDDDIFTLEQAISDEMANNKEASRLNAIFVQLYPDFHTAKTAIEHKKVVEMDKGTVENQLDFDEVAKATTKLLEEVPKPKVKQVLMHIRGTLADGQSDIIVDQVQKEMPLVDLKVVNSPGSVESHTLVEIVFFGQFD